MSGDEVENVLVLEGDVKFSQETQTLSKS